jgi:micrococcal nuclease
MKEYVYKAIVTRVVDGDTFYAEVDLGFHVTTLVCFRLANIDTPEIYSPSNELELIHGREAKTFVEDMILNKEVVIRTYKTGKYGRWLAVVYLEGATTLSEELVKAGLAKKGNYDVYEGTNN